MGADRRRRRRWQAGVAIAALAVALSARADEHTDLEGDAGARVLPEIVVTAQKVEQTLQDVPASVSTLDGSLIRESGAFGFPDLQTYTPNINIRLTPVTSDIYIRGFGTASTNAGFEPSVASVIDGVYYGRSTFLSAFFHDIDRVEVLRGPQGTLFGKNSSAGVMNLVTSAPEQDFAARAEVLYGDFGERSLRPVLNLPLGDAAGLRLSGNYQSDSGLLHNTLLDRPEYNIAQQNTRARARWVPGEKWSLDVSGFYASQHLNNNVFQLSHVSADMLALDRTYDALAEDSARNFLNSNNVPSLADVTFKGLSATLERDLAGLTGLENLRLTSIAAFGELVNQRREFDADFSPVPFVRVSQLKPSPFRQWSEELRVSGHGPDFWGHGYGVDFVSGLYYYQATLSAADQFLLEDLGAAFAYISAANSGKNGASSPDGAAGTLAGNVSLPFSVLGTLLASGAGPQAAVTTLDQRTRSYAIFGQFENFLTPHWAMIAGLRLGREHKSGVSSSASNSAIIKGIAAQEDHVSPIDRNEDELSPKLGAKWAPDRDFNVFATWSRGFKGGGFNAIALNTRNLDFGPERATSWELGTKLRLLHGSMRWSATAFTTDFDDLQVSTFRDASFIILNAARARSRGFETDLNWLPPLEGTSLTASAGLTDAYYLSYPDAPAPADAPTGAACVPIANQGVPMPPPAPQQSCVATQDLTGRRLPITPRWSATLIPAYAFDLPYTRLGATFAVDLLYRGGRFLDVDLDPHTFQPATTEVNARLSFATVSKAWQMTFAARNLTNEVIYEQVLDQPLAPGNFAAIRADRGRFYSANVVYTF